MCVVGLGAASSSDDEPLPSEEDEESPPNKDQPYLRFQITSDDGFSVEADSIEGRPAPITSQACCLMGGGGEPVPCNSLFSVKG